MGGGGGGNVTEANRYTILQMVQLGLTANEKVGQCNIKNCIRRENGRQKKNKKFSIVTRIPETWDWKRGDREIDSKKRRKM